MLSPPPSTIRSAPAEACSHPGMLSVWMVPPEPISRGSSTLCWRPSAMKGASAEAHQSDEGVRDHQKDEEETYCRLLEQLPPFDLFQRDPELGEWWRPDLPDGQNKGRRPPRCDHFRIKLSAKKSQALWSHRETPRFFRERAGAVPIRVSRLVTDEHGRPRLERAGGSGRTGAISFVCLEPWQHISETEEESGLVREVAVIRRSPGVKGGLALTSNVEWLGVRLHDKLFALPCSAATVTFTFSEGWFYVPAQWSEERLFATRPGLDFIDITSTLEKLIGTLYQLYEQEERDKKMARELQEQERRIQEEQEEKPLDYIPLGWGKEDDSRWETPGQVMHRRFALLLDDTHGLQLRCSYLEQESPRDMRRRITTSCDDDDARFVLPLTSSLEEPVGFVEGYLDPNTVGFPDQGETSARLRRPVLMVSAAPQSQGVQVVTFKFLADRLAIRLDDDGFVLTGWSGISVDVHCDSSNDMFLSHISTQNWTVHVLEWGAGYNSPIPCKSLLVQLQRKHWKVNNASVTAEELGLDAMFAPVEKEEYDDGRQQQEEEEEEEEGLNKLDTLPLSVPPQGEGEGEFSLLFASPEQSDWMEVPEPYVPKFPTDKEIQERKERRIGQLKQVMSPVTQPLRRRGWNFFMDRPGIAVTREARLPMHAAVCNNWNYSDESESTWQCKSNVYPRLACLEWCTCGPSIMLQVYTLELILVDSLHSCKLDISGFVAIRDFLDGRRNYIFNRGILDPLTVASKNGVVLLPTLSPRRAIIPAILLEFDLKVKRAGDGIDSYQQLIQGVAEHPSGGGPSWSRVNELSIRSDDDRVIPMMRVKLAMIMDGVEATIEIRPLKLPSQGIDLRCTSRTGRIGDDIVLFHGRFVGEDSPLQFVVATELHGSMEIHLEGVSNGVRKKLSIGFVPKFHALFSEAVDFSFAQVSLSVAWSVVGMYRTDGPPDLG